MVVLCVRHRRAVGRPPAHFLRPVELIPARDPVMLAHLIAGALTLDDLLPIFNSCAARAKYDCIFSHAS